VCFANAHEDLDITTPATRARAAEELAEQFAAALAASGPHLIEAVLTTG
jgi:thiamine pyrophosphate-dependent acetolactate synthase large subunit-like protein